MSRRAHAVVVVTTVSLASVLNTGCFFFGGGGDKKDKAARVPQASAPQMSASEAALAAAAPQPATTGEPLDPQVIAARQARDKALAEALAPKDSTVAWPSVEELRIGTKPAEPSRAGRQAVQPMPEPQPAAPPPRSYAAPQPQLPAAELERTVDAVAGASTVAAGARPQAVANAHLALSDAEAGTAPAPSAGLDGARTASAAQQPSGEFAGDALSRRIAQRLRDNPGDIATQLDHQLLGFLTGDAAPDLNTLSTLPAEDREMLTAIVDALVNFRNGVRADQNTLLSRKVRPLLEMAARLRSQAELSIPTIALCDRVDGFGKYIPIDGRFAAGKENPMIVYCEVGNVASQQNEQGEWESKLSQEVVLYTEDGLPAWTSQQQVVPDKSRNRRHDFYLAQIIVLPPNLSIDRYILKVTVSDEQVKRVAEATMPITIVGGVNSPPVAQQRPVRTPQQGQPVAPGVAGSGMLAPSQPADNARTAAERQAVVPLQSGLEPADGK